MVAFILVCLVLTLGLLWGWETRKRKSWEQEFVKKKNGVCFVKKNSDTILYNVGAYIIWVDRNFWLKRPITIIWIILLKDKRKVMSRGFNGYLSKPLNKELCLICSAKWEFNLPKSNQWWLQRGCVWCKECCVTILNAELSLIGSFYLTKFAVRVLGEFNGCRPCVFSCFLYHLRLDVV